MTNAELIVKVAEAWHLERTGIAFDDCEPDWVEGKYVCVCEDLK